jgi:hypothetical protein
MLYENVSERRGHWLMVSAVSSQRPGPAIGARITVSCGDRKLVAEVQHQTGYLSGSDPRVHFGVGNTQTIDWIEVLWPDGSAKAERFSGVHVDRVVELKQGTGETLERVGGQP